MEDRQDTDQEPLYVICQIGSRSEAACERFIEAGYDEVVNVEGGTAAWREAGLPLATQKGVVGIQRQVQMTAGGLVLAGSLLGFFLHPWFVGIPAFIGAGLVFAGVTNTCAMGAVLARMPWNRRAPVSTSATG